MKRIEGVVRSPFLLTLEETLDDQNNLEKLCQDRPLITNEIFYGNAYYGIDRVLKAYAKIPIDRRLKVVIPHGVYLSDRLGWKEERDVALPAVLAYPAYRQETYRLESDKLVLPAASPFLYAMRLLKKQPAVERKGTIFFPAHSTHNVTSSMDFDHIADELVKLDKRFQPITVCIYWRDYNLGDHEPFERRGLRVVSAGHMFDHRFLIRLYHLFSLHKYAAGNGLGSQMFYAIKAGCAYFHLDFEYSYSGEETALKRDVNVVPEGRQREIMSLFRTPLPKPTPAQISLADYYLGSAYLRTPVRLRLELGLAELIDRFGFSIYKDSAGIQIRNTTYFRRHPGRRPDRLIRRLLSRMVQ